LFEQAVDGGGMHLDARMEYLPEFCLPQDDRQGSPLQLLPDTISLSLANFVGFVVGVLDVLVIRLRRLLLAAALSFESEMV